MSTYPGENPQPPEGPPPEDSSSESSSPGAEQPDGTEPTMPVGYWEQQAAEQARWQQPQQGGTRPYEQGPYGPPPGYASPPPYGQQGYAQTPYPQQAYGPPPGQPAYGYPPPGGQSGPPPGYPPYAGFAPPRPDHPQSNLALILGIVGLLAGFTCGVGFLASPFAWALGRNAVKEIQASHGQLGGEGSAKAGMVMGIIGTVVLILAVLLLILFAVLVAVGETSGTSNV